MMETWQGLSTFYATFKKTEPVKEWTSTNTSPYTNQCGGAKVVYILSMLHPRKSPGPDWLKGRILKECEAQLSGVVAQLFQLFLNTSFVPRSWKETTIIPVPNNTQAKAMSDFRPVALILWGLHPLQMHAGE